MLKNITEFHSNLISTAFRNYFFQYKERGVTKTILQGFISVLAHPKICAICKQQFQKQPKKSAGATGLSSGPPSIMLMRPHEPNQKHSFPDVSLLRHRGLPAPDPNLALPPLDSLLGRAIVHHSPRKRYVRVRNLAALSKQTGFFFISFVDVGFISAGKKGKNKNGENFFSFFPK
ncbi:hypothetical protein CDAR_321621 [Caerostris darwini]|uniref:Uncharacterized protein n=1 Tax=Caerostris darwini TaxID=1538125 RepID=A0AAV4VUI4_9ARAC|nr:hypothetical protein CDAR_321621 [Caerostris darwini]